MLQMEESGCSGEIVADLHMIIGVFDPEIRVGVLDRCPFAGMLQSDKQRRGMSYQGLNLLA